MAISLEPALLERERELAELDGLLAAARAGNGRLLLVEGAAGLGKTRLLREARRRADLSGMRVLAARATELERDFPFGVVRQLFEPAVTVLERSERRIAQMAAEGRTNREIAQTLFLTLKTVETHLSHTYRKLDITSRVELPRALAAG